MDVVREVLVFKVVVFSCGCIGFGWEDRDIFLDLFFELNLFFERFFCLEKKNCSFWYVKRLNIEI